MRACACGERTIAEKVWPVEAEVIGVAALAGEQARVLLAADRLADGAEGSACGKLDLFVHAFSDLSGP